MHLFLDQGKLHPTSPFDFDKSLNFLKIFTPSQNEQLISGRSLTKAISIKGQAFIFRIKSVGTIDRPVLEYILLSEHPISEDQKYSALDRASFFLSLYDNLQSFYEAAANDLHFNPVIRRLYGYHQVKFLTPFENACWAVLTQRLPVLLAKRMKDLLVQTYGAPIQTQTSLMRSFPEPSQLSLENVKHLAKLLGNPQKAAYLHYLARAFHEVDEDFLRHAPYDQVQKWLQDIKGIGTWSATFILIRGLGRMERVPATDRRLIHAASRFYGQEVDRTIPQIADQYGSWQGYWAHYLKVVA